jgi:hypothetical protein
MQADKLRELLADLAADSRAPRLAGVLDIRCANFLRDNGTELLAIAEAAEDLRADAMRLDWLFANLSASDLWHAVYPHTPQSPEQLRAAIDALSTVAPVREG